MFWETIIQTLKEEIPYGIYIIAGIISLWKIAEFYFVRFRKIEEITNGFEKEIKPKVDRTDKNLNTLIVHLRTKRYVDTDLAFLNSPLQLTEKGKNLLKESHLSEIIDDNLDKFLENIAEKSPQTGYDVETSAFLAIFSFFNDPIMNPFKHYLYEHPKVNQDDILKLGSIYLREKYLEKHPEITQ